MPEENERRDYSGWVALAAFVGPIAAVGFAYVLSKGKVNPLDFYRNLKEAYRSGRDDKREYRRDSQDI